jgi:MoaA/NifB/PqqE/SkfB family radical SAM enzyme
LFWILLTLALLFSFFYSLFKDRQKFPLFFILWPILIYNALLISPFANVRYRLPFYIFFFLALVYCGGLLLKSLRDVNDIMLYVKKNIRRYPLLARWLKKTYDWRLERKTWRRIDEFFKKDLPYVKAPPPQYVIGHEPTIRCNLRCKMCYQGETRALRGDELSTGQILEIYGKLKGRISEIKLVGGEPMVRPDILELIAFWDQAGVRLILQSNCTMIGENNIEQLKKYSHLTDILTSLDGPKDLHDAIRGVPGTFDKLQKAVNLIKNKMPQVPITVFATLLINDNIDKFYELIDTAKELGLGTVNVLFEQVYSREEIEQTKNKFKLWGWESGKDYRLNTQERNPIFPPGLNTKELKKKLSAIREYGLKKDCFVNFTPFNFYRHLDQYLGRKKNERVFCLKLLEPELRISQRGEVVWCDIIEKSFGNLLEKTPDEIWLSQDYQNFRKFLSQRSLPVCSRCCKAFYYK